jgi:glycosyltransferase involved in cell wall biosynthesis
LPRFSVAMVADDFLPAGTGVGVHVQKVARELAARGHRVVVITSRRRNQPFQENWNGVAVERVFSLPVFGFYQALPAVSTLRRLFLKHSVGLVHFHYLGQMMLRGLALARGMGLPTVYTAHMSVDHLTQPAPLRPFRSWLLRRIVRTHDRFDDVICVSSEHAEQVRRFATNARVHFISNPVSFRGDEAAPPREPGFTAFYAGRLNPEKNVGLLLRAFAALPGGGPSDRLWIAGQGSMEKEWRALARSLGVAPRVKFLGHVPHERLADLYAACDVFVLPSLVETQGLVALEAMRFKKPVIVTDRIISARDLVDDGKTGYIVPADAPDVLAERMDRLRGDPALRERLGAGGYEKSAPHTAAAVAAALEGVYARFADDPAAPTFRETAPRLDTRRRCAYCQIGTVDRAGDRAAASSDFRRFSEEFFAVWKCAVCRSIHSLPKIPLDEFYKASPFPRRRLNRWNRKAFEGFRRWLAGRGVGPWSRILFYGVNADLFRSFFEEKGFLHFAAADGTRGESPPGADGDPLDCLIVLDELERLEEPRQIFEFARRRLRAGGLLVVHTQDADRLRLGTVPAHALHQPFRLHIPSWTALRALGEALGFRVRSVERRHYLDTRFPFVNFRAFSDLAFFRDGSLDSAFDFRPRDVLKKWWRGPRFLWLGIAGGFWRDRSNLMAVFEKRVDPAAGGGPEANE